MNYKFPSLPLPKQFQDLLGKELNILRNSKPLVYRISQFDETSNAITNYCIECITDGYECSFNVSKASSKGISVYTYITAITSLRRISVFIPYSFISIENHPNDQQRN